MKVIFKYPLVVTDEQTVALPEGAHFLSVMNQNEQIVLYARVDPTMPVKHHKVWIVGTGHECSHTVGHGFLGTVKIGDGLLMWHVFFEAPTTKRVLS